jgi:two-component system, OmpR family, phosphate regulon response regulator PhoB
MGSPILVVHEQQELRGVVRRALIQAGHHVQEAEDLGAAAKLRDRLGPELILIPWTTLSAVREVLARLKDREATWRSHVIVLAPTAVVADAIVALEFGADDCIAVPIREAELVARVNACLRRPAAAARPDQLRAGPLLLDKGVHVLLVADEPVPLAPTEFRLMSFFLENQGRVFSRDELLRRAWSKNIKAGHRTVDVHVRRLRQLLEPYACDDMIQTVRGFGYRFSVNALDSQSVGSATRAEKNERLNSSQS